MTSSHDAWGSEGFIAPPAKKESTHTHTHTCVINDIQSCVSPPPPPPPPRPPPHPHHLLLLLLLWSILVHVCILHPTHDSRSSPTLPSRDSAWSPARALSTSSLQRITSDSCAHGEGKKATKAENGHKTVFGLPLGDHASLLLGVFQKLGLARKNIRDIRNWGFQ